MGHTMTSHMHLVRTSGRRGGVLRLLVGLLCFLTWPSVVLAQFDLCGCSGNTQTLGNFDTADVATYPPGTTTATTLDNFGYRAITLPLPEDGVLIFNRFTVAGLPGCPTCLAKVVFQLNATNSPVTLLVAGDVMLSNSSWINLDGQNGTSGSLASAGTGGLGGPGGFRGGDGAYAMVNFVGDGGAGFGPSGGAPGIAAPFTNAVGGIFSGRPELRQLIGGSGGGGGASLSQNPGCAGGGGGGGGGAILIAANGTITLNGFITARGATFGSAGNSSCASRGGGGGSGAIRLIATTITGTRSDALQVSVGGVIRLEAITNTFAGSSLATALAVPGPLYAPLTPTVAITSVNGEILSVANSELLAERPEGGFGEVDVIVPSSGPVMVALETTGVPSGTTVDVTVKPRVGGAPHVEHVTLTACGTNGTCVASVLVDLAPGAYVLEARATFQLP
jgi:hypothetical protein